VKTLDSGLAVLAMNGVIPLRYQVPKWATLVTKRYTAVHAPARLFFNNV
jgi:hypothetical protein